MTTRRRTALLAAILAVLVVLPGVAYGAGQIINVPPDGKVVTLLLLGSDEGPPRDSDPTTGRADAIHLLFVSGDRQHATFVSIPRDSYVPVAGSGTTKINACLARGPENCVVTMEQEFGITIDGYILTSMWGFAEAVNEFAGCPPGADVPCPAGGFEIDIKDTCDKNCGGVPIPEAGVQKVTGYQALANARHRKTRPEGDFGRSKAQAEMLSIAHAQVEESGNLLRVMQALRIMRRHSVSDIPPERLARLAVESLTLPPANVRREFAPSTLGTAGDASVVFLQPALYTLITDVAADGKVG